MHWLQSVVYDSCRIYDKNVLVYIWKLNYSNPNSVTYTHSVQIVLTTIITLRLFLYSEVFTKYFGELTSPASPRLRFVIDELMS